tara:strand:+ start:107 stop:331 length:225 start_codon:yes stop_codon:yes gene_type:complete
VAQDQIQFFYVPQQQVEEVVEPEDHLVQRVLLQVVQVEDREQDLTQEMDQSVEQEIHHQLVHLKEIQVEQVLMV